MRPPTTRETCETMAVIKAAKTSAPSAEITAGLVRICFKSAGADPAIEERCGNDDRNKGTKQHGARGVAEKASQGPLVRASRSDNRDTAKEKSPGGRERDRNNGATVKQRRAVPITDQHDRADNCRQRAQSARPFRDSRPR